MVVNYRPQPLAPLLVFALFVFLCLVAAPLWYFGKFGVHADGVSAFFVSRALVAPIGGGVFLFLVARTLQFNARVREDSRALTWNSTGISLWRGSQSETVPWDRVRNVQVQRSNGPLFGSRKWLEITAAEPSGALRKWRFSPIRLQLAGQSLSDLAALIEQARSGSPAFPNAPSPAAAPDGQSREDAVAAARGKVAIVVSIYFITLVGMALYIASLPTTPLSPPDPRQWICAKLAFFAAGALTLLWCIVASWKTPILPSRPGLQAVPGFLMIAATIGGLVGGWVYLVTEVAIIHATSSLPVRHGTAILSVKRDGVREGWQRVRGQLRGQSGREVTFLIGPADLAAMDAARNPDGPDKPSCLAVPAEMAGTAIRADAREDTLLPPGSIRPCP